MDSMDAHVALLRAHVSAVSDLYAKVVAAALGDDLLAYLALGLEPLEHAKLPLLHKWDWWKDWVQADQSMADTLQDNARIREQLVAGTANAYTTELLEEMAREHLREALEILPMTIRGLLIVVRKARREEERGKKP